MCVCGGDGPYVLPVYHPSFPRSSLQLQIGCSQLALLQEQGQQGGAMGVRRPGQGKHSEGPSSEQHSNPPVGLSLARQGPVNGKDRPTEFPVGGSHRLCMQEGRMDPPLPKLRSSVSESLPRASPKTQKKKALKGAYWVRPAPPLQDWSSAGWCHQQLEDWASVLPRLVL